jgi:vacuolar iron transporter family protein
MKKSAALIAHEKRNERRDGSALRQVILGGQDGLVNTLGVILGVAAGTGDSRIVLIAGLAAAFAESISMAAVAYTSSRASEDFHKSEREREQREMEEEPEIEREEIQHIYYKKGFRGKQLAEIVRKITSDKKRWLDVMMMEELGLGNGEKINPRREATVVGGAAFAGSAIPLIPFIFVPVPTAAFVSAAVAVAVLFSAGAVKAKMTTGNWARAGLEMAVIGGLAAFVGYAIGAIAGTVL